MLACAPAPANVLEHTFDPIRALDTTADFVAPGGHLVVCAPTSWPLHYFPLDCWRMNPGLFVEYAKRRGLTLLREHFLWVAGGMRPIENDEASLPRYARNLAQRVVARTLIAMGAPIPGASFLSVGAVLKKA